MKKLSIMLAAAAFACAGAANTAIASEADVDVSNTLGNTAAQRFARAVSDAARHETAPAKVPEGGTWKAIGQGTYSDELICDVFAMYSPGTQWTVTIEQNSDAPGWYRFIPYNENSPIYGMAGILADVNYLYINATDPEKVYCDDFNAYSSFDFFQVVPESPQGAAYMAENNLPAVYGKLENGLITFPARSHCYYSPAEDNSTGVSSIDPVNVLGLLRVALPGSTVPPLWEDLGEGTFTDGILGAIFGDGVVGGVPQEQTVMIQRHSSVDGLFRVVNPWEKYYNSTKALTIDASRPDCIIIDEQPVGVTESSMGPVYVLSRSAISIHDGKGGLTHDEYIAKYPEYNITLKDGVIDIPGNACVFFFPETDAEHYYPANKPLPSRIVLPEGWNGIGSLNADTGDAPAEYFNLQGMRVDAPGAGIYLRRQGGKVSKVIIR